MRYIKINMIILKQYNQNILLHTHRRSFVIKYYPDQNAKKLVF